MKIKMWLANALRDAVLSDVQKKWLLKSPISYIYLLMWIVLYCVSQTSDYLKTDSVADPVVICTDEF